MNILGISAFYHDSAAALLRDGRIIAAAQEERFTRKKHDSAYPINAIKYCLAEAGITHSQLDHVVFYDKPFLKFERLLETYLLNAPRGLASFRMAMPVWLREKLFQKKLLADHLKAHAPDIDWEKKLLFTEHHQSHAASAFYPSPFDEAVILTMDGVGEWATTSVGIGRGNKLEIHKELHFPHSLGLLYSAFTYYCGFKVNSGEYKLMGLAPYGQPIHADLIKNKLIDIKPDGTFALRMEYFNFATGLTMTNARFHALFGRPPRNPEANLTQSYMDVAASIQQVLEEIILMLTHSLAQEYGISNLCLAGGVALNCVANGKILREGAFKNIWVQPAAGDAGGALGAALAAHHLYLNNPRTPETPDGMQGSYLGPGYTQPDCEYELTLAGANYEILSDEELFTRTARKIAEGQTVGWFQGRMEFGPRALGNRSILADPRNPEIQQKLNLQVKLREGFRPFAPSVLREYASKYFELQADSPYMLMVATIAASQRLAENPNLSGLAKLKHIRSTLPAITHVDYSARVQTVDARTNPRYHALIEAFRLQTGCPMLVNTSFNLRSEPVVRTPAEAFRCFMASGFDLLVVGNCWLEKPRQNPALKINYAEDYAPD